MARGIVDNGSGDRRPGELPPRFWDRFRRFKIIFVAVLAGLAGLIALLTVFRTHPAQSTVERVFELVQEGDIERVMDHVDPEGQLGTLWYENAEGSRDALLSLMERYRLEFSSLALSTRAEGDLAEVSLAGGRIAIYERDAEGPPTAFFDLGELELVFYLEREGGRWLIEGVNYDLVDLLSGEDPLLPF